jgi:hypothetical protein
MGAFILFAAIFPLIGFSSGPPAKSNNRLE